MPSEPLTLLLATPNPDPVPGLVVAVRELPKCNFCEETAHFDFATKAGPWAFGCSYHYFKYRAVANLGVGKGQRLVVRP
jgi:hypothetical protein